MNPTLYPVSLNVESHPSGSVLNIVADLNSPTPLRLNITRDIACILRAELDRALTR